MTRILQWAMAIAVVLSAICAGLWLVDDSYRSVEEQPIIQQVP